jgi:glutamate dehydrogenase (NAD(P)+)
VGHSVPEIVTGKPPVLGGTTERRPATGLGVVYVIEGMMERLGWSLREQRVVVQGFGNVGEVVANELRAIGATVVGLSDATGGISGPDGIDVEAATEWVREHGGLEGFTGEGTKPIGRSEVLELDCDILVPAALERQITAENADQLACRIVVEAANGPTTPEAEAILATRGIHIVPDVLANAGGVCVSYYEWVQDQQKFSWDAIEIQERLRRQMRTALAKVWDAAQARDIDWRTAALTVAVARVAEAARLRAIYP